MLIERLAYAQKWRLNPWGREVWGELAENNELYGVTEEQIAVCREYSRLEIKELREATEQSRQEYTPTSRKERPVKAKTVYLTDKVLKDSM